MTVFPFILIVDDDQRMVRTLVDILALKGFRAESAFTAEQALEKLHQQDFDCILTDIKLPGMNGVDFYRTIHELHPAIPVVLMTAYAADDLIAAGLREGVIAALIKPLNIHLLLKFLSHLRKEHMVVIVDDDRNLSSSVEKVLRSHGLRPGAFKTPRKFLQAGRQTESRRPPQVVILDLKLADLKSLDVIRKIRDKFPHVPVILVTGSREGPSNSTRTVLAKEVHACLFKPFRMEELLNSIDTVRLNDLRSQLEQPMSKP